jgi:hypothetical protein
MQNKEPADWPQSGPACDGSGSWIAESSQHLVREAPIKLTREGCGLRRAFPRGLNRLRKKAVDEREFEYWHLQGLKPDVDLMGFIGLTKSHALLQSPGELRLQRVFPQPVKLSKLRNR